MNEFEKEQQIKIIELQQKNSELTKKLEVLELALKVKLDRSVPSADAFWVCKEMLRLIQED